MRKERGRKGETEEERGGGRKEGGRVSTRILYICVLPEVRVIYLS